MKYPVKLLKKIRLIIVVVLTVSTVYEFYDLMYRISWSLISESDKMLTLISIVVEFCGAVLAFWAYDDRKRIEELREVVSKLQEQREKE